MIKWVVFVVLWERSMRGGVLRGHWRWLSMGAFLLGAALDAQFAT